MENWFDIVQRTTENRSFSDLIDEIIARNDSQTERLWFSLWASDIASVSIKFEKADTDEERFFEAGYLFLGISACAILIGLTEEDILTTSKYPTSRSLSYHAMAFNDYVKSHYFRKSGFDLFYFKFLLKTVAARLSEDIGLNEALKAVDQKLQKRFTSLFHLM